VIPDRRNVTYLNPQLRRWEHTNRAAVSPRSEFLERWKSQQKKAECPYSGDTCTLHEPAVRGNVSRKDLLTFFMEQLRCSGLTNEGVATWRSLLRPIQMTSI
jgi:hypothetical protein